MNNKVDTSKLKRQLESLMDIDVLMAARAGTEVIFDRSQELVPVLSGELRDSGEVVEHEDGYAVQYTAPHAAPVEYGTSKMQSHPYLRPAIDEQQKEILEAIAEEVNDEIERKL